MHHLFSKSIERNKKINSRINMKIIKLTFRKSLIVVSPCQRQISVFFSVWIKQTHVLVRSNRMFFFFLYVIVKYRRRMIALYPIYKGWNWKQTKRISQWSMQCISLSHFVWSVLRQRLCFFTRINFLLLCIYLTPLHQINDWSLFKTDISQQKNAWELFYRVLYGASSFGLTQSNQCWIDKKKIWF